MRLKLSHRLFIGIFIGMVGTFLLTFIIVDRILLTRYEMAYQEHLLSLIEELAPVIETAGIEEVDDILNHFAFSHHANVHVSTFILDEGRFLALTDFKGIPDDVLRIIRVTEEATRATDRTDEVLVMMEEDGNIYYFAFELALDESQFDEMDTIDGADFNYFLFTSKWVFHAAFETFEMLDTYVETTYLDEEDMYILILNDAGMPYLLADNREDLKAFLNVGRDFTEERRTFEHLFLFDVPVIETMVQLYEFENWEQNLRHELVIEMTFAPATHVINQLRLMAIPLFALVLLISFLISIFFALSLSRPIVSMRQVSQKMSTLDLTVRNPIKRRDELGDLAQDLNTMASKLAHTMTDLTAANEQLQIEMEKAKAIDAQRKEFYMSVSHELKTPLMILKTQLSGMLEGIGVYQNRELYLQKAQETTDDMSELVKNILQVANLTAPQMRLELEEIEMSGLIERIITKLETLADEKNISMTHFCQPNAIITADKFQIGTAISNVITNAIVHSKAGSFVNIQLHKTENLFVLTVENFGVKLQESEIQKLFEPFYRPDKSRNRYTGGSGMGLYIVKSILNLHHFKFELKNTEKGVMFEIIFAAPQTHNSLLN